MLRENELYEKLNETQKDTIKRLVESIGAYKDKDCELQIQKSDSIHIPDRIILKYDDVADMTVNTSLTVEDINRR